MGGQIDENEVELKGLKKGLKNETVGVNADDGRVYNKVYNEVIVGWVVQGAVEVAG